MPKEDEVTVLASLEREDETLRAARSDVIDEKPDVFAKDGQASLEVHAVDDLGMLHDEVAAIEGKIDSATLEWTYAAIRQARKVHTNDQNFPGSALQQMNRFLDDPDVMAHPKDHAELIREMKMEAILSTENSPYQEVRANVDNTDDPTMPSLTIRVWIIGTVFAGIGSFIDTLFLVRQPAISVGPNVAQMVAYPCGRFLARVLPTRTFQLMGRTVSLNPGPFNKKEHMLITIMASVSFSYPYTAFLIPTLALPQYFDQKYAFNFGFQLLSTLGINFVGFGLAGLFRRFLVFPAFALWPSSLATIALNKAFHSDRNEPVVGPRGWTIRRSRGEVFMMAFGAMFVWFFFPGFIFQALSVFNWLSWIAPNNMTLNNITGFNNGVGLNPWPTFDWNNLTPWLTPLTIPTFAIVSQFIGICIGTMMTIGFYWTNAWNSSYLPINNNAPFDNRGKSYNVTRVLGDDNLLDNTKYQNYSQPWMSAGFCTYLIWYFAMYGATLSYVVVYHRHDIAMAGRTTLRGFKRVVLRRKELESDSDEADLAEDVHFRLMKAYPEVPEWWFGILLVISMVIGMLGVGLWPTDTTPAVVVYGIIMPLIAILPCGIVQMVTGIAIPLQVLAQFIGGAFSGGSGVTLMFFKSYGYISMYQALAFCNDLKLAHYIKIPPRHTFIGQVWAVLINSFVSASLFNFQMSFRGVCTPDADFKFTCPGQRTFFSGGVFWGVLGPSRLFGAGNRYNLLLLGFPIGIMIPIAHLLLRRYLPKQEWIRQIHPVMIAAGPANWGSPYNFSYFWPNVMVAWFSFQFVRSRYTALWAKYNYVIAAAFPAGIAVAALVIFFALELPVGGLSIDWWGNSVSYEGCEGSACTRFPIPESGYFGPAPGTNSFT